jgi:hypothetical protein
MPKVTKLSRFLSENGLSPTVLLPACGRTHAWRLREGKSAPSMTTAIAVVDALSATLQRPVGLGEVFDISSRKKRRTRARTRA